MINTLLIVVACIIVVPVGVFVIEVLGSFLPPRRVRTVNTPPSDRPLRSAIIIPAHNESTNLIPTLETLLSTREQSEHCSIFVVADNCSDDTANIARAELAGAPNGHVLERHDPTRRGKGYALAFGLEALRADPPDIVVFLDADCLVQPNALDRLIKEAARTWRPVQAMYLMDTTQNGDHAPAPELKVGAFAWLVMNRVRMGGLFNLFDVTRLTGSGMAFPYPILRDHFRASGEIVEDLALTVKLVGAGHPPILVPKAIVTSTLATHREANTTQRARWERGSLAMIGKAFWPLLWQGLTRLDARALALAFDIALPPLVITGGGLIIAIALLALPALIGITSPVIIVGAGAMIFGLALIIAWFAYARDVLPVSGLVGLFGFVYQKLRIHGDKGRQSTKSWTRTGRDE